MRKLVLFIATGSGSGYAPIAPGTAGSAVGVGLWALCVQGPGLSTGAMFALLVVLTAVGIWAAGEAEKTFQKRDDGRITVDEIAGQWLALALLPVSWEMALAAFLLFRLFDIWKPWPVRLAERLPGGLGVVADDLIAGLYANLAGQLLWRVLLSDGGPGW
jgi:phosphatidylglycerophosphatase A